MIRAPRRAAWLLPALLVCAGMAACARAPLGPYTGPPFAPRPPLTAGGLGADSLVVIVYGDSRPGPRMATTPWGLGAIIDADSREPLSWLWAAANAPVALVQAIVPQLDGVRDLISSRWTRIYSGGGEARVLRALERETDAALVVHSGDMVENGMRGEQWRRFVERHRTLGGRGAFAAVPGNHERLGSPLGRANWDAAIGTREETGRYWHVLDLPGGLARFVFLDSNVLADSKRHYPDSLEAPLAEAQLAWADSVLGATAASLKFLVLHHPLVSAGQHFSDWKLDPKGPASRRGRLLEMCARHRVTAVFAGHEHLYQRLYLRGPEGRGFWHITSGGAGSPLHRISRAERAEAIGAELPSGYQVVWTRPSSVYHYCRVVLGTGSRPTARLDVRSVDPSGNTTRMETIDLTAPPTEDAPHVR